MAKPQSPGFSHFDADGKAVMVDVGVKPDTAREAVAGGTVLMSRETFDLVRSGSMHKGDVLGVARIAGIMAAKKTDDLIPLAHPLPITRISVDFQLDQDRSAVDITARVGVTGKTGVEMEALTAVTISALTIYDMCKALDKRMEISNIRLLKKAGGKSGTFVRDDRRTEAENG